MHLTEWLHIEDLDSKEARRKKSPDWDPLQEWEDLKYDH